MNQNNTKRKRRGNRGRGQRGGNNPAQYVRPILGKLVNNRNNVTMESGGVLTFAAGASGVTASLAWNTFNHYTQLSQEYKYFEYESAQMDVVYDAPSGTDGQLILAWYPINHNTETAPTAVPTNQKQVDSLAGSLDVMPGSSNKGPWFPTLIKQQFSSLAASNLSAGTIYGFMNNKSSSSVQVNVVVRLNCCFYVPAYNIVGAIRAGFEFEATQLIEKRENNDVEYIVQTLK